MLRLNFFGSRVLAAWVVISGACLVTPGAQAQVAGPAVLTDEQGYKYLTPYVYPNALPTDSKEKVRLDTQKSITNAQSQIRAMLGGAPIDGNRFDYYYLRMLFPKFTLTTDEALKDLPKERERLMRDNLEACADPAIHRRLVNLVLNQMKTIVQDKYHPACRYNAMLVISGLNSVEAERTGADKRTPEPLIDALGFILEQFTQGENDAIRVAALLGLVRHLEWDNFRGPVNAPTPAIAPPQREAIVKQLLALAQAKQPPEGRDAAGHEWFRRRAIEGLMHASYYQVDPAVGSALENLVKDESESLAIRCAAASAMGEVVFRDPAKLEPAPIAKELGYLALVACDKELTRVTNLNKEEMDRLQRMGAGGGYGSMGGYPGGGSGGLGAGMGSDSPGYGSGAAPGAGRRGRGGSGGYPGGSGSSGYPGASGYPGGSEASDGGYGYGTLAPPDPKQYRFDLVRRRLRSQLYAVEVGLGGPDVNIGKGLVKPGEAPAAPTGPPRGVEALAKNTPDEPVVAEISKLVGKLVETVESTDNTDMASLEKELRKQMKPLEAKTRKLAVAPTATDVPADVPAAPGAPPARPAPAGTPTKTPAAAGAPRAPGGPAPGGPAPGGPAPGGPATAPAAAPQNGVPTPPAPGAPAAPAPRAPAPRAPAPGAPAAPGAASQPVAAP
jgi:hypothetical protein